MRARWLPPAILLAACGGAGPARDLVWEPAVGPVLVAYRPHLAPGVTALDPVCAEGVEEACDAIDQDCDGRIDEGCEGCTDAPFVAALAWNGSADLDLVFEFATSTTAATTADMDRLRSGIAYSAPEGQRVERLALRELVEATYRVGVAYRGSCGDDASDAGSCGDEQPVTVSLSLSVNGAVHGPFNRTLMRGETADLVWVAVGTCVTRDCMPPE